MKCPDRTCRQEMTVDEKGAFQCVACGCVVRLTEFTGGYGPTTASRPSEDAGWGGSRKRRSDAADVFAELDLGILPSAAGSLA